MEMSLRHLPDGIRSVIAQFSKCNVLRAVQAAKALTSAILQHPLHVKEVSTVHIARGVMRARSVQYRRRRVST